MERCEWAGSDELMINYHDHEWGVPVHDDRLLFEFLTLEGAQAGLSWITILRKREHYRAALYDFELDKVAGFSYSEIEELLDNPSIVRNRGKMKSTVSNARRVLEIQREYGSFNEYIWSFTNGKPVQNYWKSHNQIPLHTAQSCKMSKDMKKRGFRFVGPTICYSFMQAVGMVNDHTVNCFRHMEISRMNMEISIMDGQVAYLPCIEKNI
ncbi:MAG: DNA-3-methyladenine glycosylase I [Desulfamplus sp.]|nr:DNA-3-methyladenine glycosylase I [Desulfamplus sp.]